MRRPSGKLDPDQRRSEAGLARVSCPTCGRDAWREPPLTVINPATGERREVEQIRCAHCAAQAKTVCRGCQKPLRKHPVIGYPRSGRCPECHATYIARMQAKGKPPRAAPSWPPVPTPTPEPREETPMPQTTQTDLPPSAEETAPPSPAKGPTLPEGQPTPPDAPGALQEGPVAKCQCPPGFGCSLCGFGFPTSTPELTQKVAALCACGCKKPCPPHKSKAGAWCLYASKTCEQRAYQQRKKQQSGVVEGPGVAPRLTGLVPDEGLCRSTPLEQLLAALRQVPEEAWLEALDVVRFERVLESQQRDLAERRARLIQRVGGAA